MPNINGFYLGPCPILPPSFMEMCCVVFVCDTADKQTNQQTDWKGRKTEPVIARFNNGKQKTTLQKLLKLSDRKSRSAVSNSLWWINISSSASPWQNKFFLIILNKPLFLHLHDYNYSELTYRQCTVNTGKAREQSSASWYKCKRSANEMLLHTEFVK